MPLQSMDARKEGVLESQMRRSVTKTSTGKHMKYCFLGPDCYQTTTNSQFHCGQAHLSFPFLHIITSQRVLDRMVMYQTIVAWSCRFFFYVGRAGPFNTVGDGLVQPVLKGPGIERQCGSMGSGLGLSKTRRQDISRYGHVQGNFIVKKNIAAGRSQ